MPKYRVTLSDGRTFEIDASAQPSEADILAAIGSRPTENPATAEPASAPQTLAGYQYFADTLANVPESAGRFVTDSVKGLAGAANTAAQMISFPARSIHSLIQGDRTAVEDEAKQIGQTIGGIVPGVVSHYANRFSSPVENFKNDPVGMVADVAAIGMPLRSAGAGARTKLATTADRLAQGSYVAAQSKAAPGIRVLVTKPSVTEQAARTGSQVAGAVEAVGSALDTPLRAAGQAASQLVDLTGRGIQKAGHAVYKHALSDGDITSRVAQERARLNATARRIEREDPHVKIDVDRPFPEETGIREGILPTRRQVAKRIGEIQETIQELEQNQRPLLNAVEGRGLWSQSPEGDLAQLRQDLARLQELEASLRTSDASATGAMLGLGTAGMLTGGLDMGLLGAFLGKTQRSPVVRGAAGIGLDRAGQALRTTAPAATDALERALLLRMLEQDKPEK